MRNIEYMLKNRVINSSSLIKYGFTKQENKYVYNKNICEGQFEMIVEMQDNKMTSKLIDLMNEDEYVLVDVQDSCGEFVGKVRQEYEEKLQDIIKKCTSKEVFKFKQSKQVIEYIRKKYNDELEFLWEKFEETAIWRNKQNNKWYGLIMAIPESKIGINSEKIVEALDIRYQKNETEKIVDNEKFFPGYHMNKKSWITIKLDNSVDIKTIKKLIDNSYNLSLGAKAVKKQGDLAQKSKTI